MTTVGADPDLLVYTISCESRGREFGLFPEVDNMKKPTSRTVLLISLGFIAVV